MNQRNGKSGSKDWGSDDKGGMKDTVGTDRTSGSREESMDGASMKGGKSGGSFSRDGLHGSASGGTQDLARARATVPGADGNSDQDRGNMRGSTSGTTGLGGERNRGLGSSAGGVEGVPDQGNAQPDEDVSRTK